MRKHATWGLRTEIDVMPVAFGLRLPIAALAKDDAFQGLAIAVDPRFDRLSVVEHRRNAETLMLEFLLRHASCVDAIRAATWAKR